MLYINKNPNESGNYGNPSSFGEIALPDELLDSYIATMGFAILTLDGDTVTAVEVNEDALAAYLSEYPDAPTEEEPSADEILDILLGGGSDE